MSAEAKYAIDRARKKDLEFLKNAPLDVLLNARDDEDDSIFSVAVKLNYLEGCEVISRRCPSLLYHQSSLMQQAPLHHAAWRGNVEIMKLIISAYIKADLEYQQDIESQGGNKARPLKTLTWKENNGENAMHKSVHVNKIEGLKLLIEVDPDKEMLRAGNRNNDTPLHLAAGLRYNLEIVKLLIEADPDFPYNANKNGETPLLIAINKAELNNSPDMLKLILEKQPSQAKVRVGNNGWTALHYAVSKGFLTSVGDIIQCCPESSEVVDNEGRNFLHLAVRLEFVDIVNHILGMKVISSNVLNGEDNLGKTPLDHAAISKNETIVLCLVQDHRVEKKFTVAKHLQWVVQIHNFAMMNLLMNAIPDFLKGIESEVLLNSRDNNGDTILIKAAAQENPLFLCSEIYKRCPSLIYHKGEGGSTALHHAAVKGEPEMLKFLIDAGAKSYNVDDEEDIERGGGEKLHPKKLLAMVDEEGDTALHKAVLSHKLEAVRLLVEADPDFEYSSNISGDTPLMIAVKEAQSNENKHDTGKIRKLLFKMQPNQIKVRTGPNEWTLLHHAASNGDVITIKDIIKFCPSCLELVDNEGKNFLHIAAKKERFQVVKHFLGAREIPISVLNAEDRDGNTPLHIAATTANDSMTLCFLYDPRVIKTTVNRDGQHVLDAINFSYDKRKAGVLGITGKVDQSDLKEQSDFDLVVGALIATVSFTAGITVPGGYISEGPNQGTAVLSKKASFAAFIISNTLALILSLYAVFSHYCARRLIDDEDIKYQLNVAALCTLAAIYCMMVAFITGSFAVLANSYWLAIVVCILSCLFFIFACRPIWKIIKQLKRSTTASQHKRSTTASQHKRST